MLDYERFPLISSAVAFGLVAALTAPPFVKRLSVCKESRRGYGTIGSLYEDEDGEATEDSQAQFVRTSIVPRYLALGGVPTGCCVASLEAVITTLTVAAASHSRFDLITAWVGVGIWLLLVVQIIGVFVDRQPQSRFRSAVYGIVSALLTIAALLMGKFPEPMPSRGALLEVLSSTVVVFALASLPRRPDLFVNENLVDQEHTFSILSRVSFAWAEGVLRIASKRTLDLADLPYLKYAFRSKNLAASFVTGGSKKRLWRRLVITHAWALFYQWAMNFIDSVLTFAPQFFLLHFLRQLERRDVESPMGRWIWVLGLGLSMIVGIGVHLWQAWVTTSLLEIPVQAQLSSLVFQKVMRRQDSHNAQKVDTKPAENGAKKDGREKKPDELQAQPRQSVINHMKLDSGRVTMFCSFNVWFLTGFVELIIASTFLIILIGWKALLAGCATSILMIPITAKLSKTYGSIQFGLMKYRDSKASLLAEALQGIRQIRFSAMEQVWEDKIMDIRKQELSQIWKGAIAMVAVVLFVNLGPLLLTTISLSVFTLQNGKLTPSIAFTCLGLFDNLRTALGLLPLVGAYLWEAWISCNRLEKFFDEPERDQVLTESDSISFENATVAWPRDEERDEEHSERSILRDINLQFPNGELSVITGKTGSGKSQLLASILGEVNLLSGIIKAPRQPSMYEREDSKANAGNWIIPSAVAFVSQSPWIENITIKENVLFGLPFNADRYRKVLSACALEKDLELFAEGDMTEVGPKGISLSGGQRWRIALARALYSRAGILLLDDILSAVDAHVGKWIFDHVLTGELAEGRTRILATHHGAACSSKAAYLVNLGGGTVENAESVIHPEVAESSGSSEPSEISEDTVVPEEDLGLPLTTELDPKTAVQTTEAKTAPNEKEEKREVGRVTWKVYKAYLIASGGWTFWILCFGIQISSNFFDVARNWWLKLWTESYSERSSSLPSILSTHQIYMGHLKTQDTDVPTKRVIFYLVIYAAISFSGVLWGALSILFEYFGSLKSSESLYRRMTHTVLRAPLRWLDTVPSGRILNRFTTDMVTVDLRLMPYLTRLLWMIFKVVIITVTSILISPYLIPFALVTLVLYTYIAYHYILGAREIKRINSITSSPIYDQLGSILEGLSTVRAFDKSEFYITRMSSLIDDASRSSWYLSLLFRWMDFRMSILGAIFATIVGGAIMISGIDAALAGFTLTFALQYTQSITGLLQTITQIELGFNATERIVEYVDLETEPEDGIAVAASWPTEGRIDFQKLVAGYADGLPAVLNELSFSIAPRERIGVVGRTGAGKSSLANALFRFISARSGSICIDSLDISTLKLQDLRARLAIIPQDPFLFSGTLRGNLDIYGLRSDAELKAALSHVHLTTGFEDLDTPISSGGMNLSQGQRQLICLARAILTRPKILVLDEATSAVDMGTDSAIQTAIRSEFENSTLLVIAHRLSTISDFDKVLVLDGGRVAEFGSPRDLLEGKGVFYEMVGASGESEKLRRMILGVGQEEEQSVQMG